MQFHISEPHPEYETRYFLYTVKAYGLLHLPAILGLTFALHTKLEWQRSLFQVGMPNLFLFQL